MPRLEGDLHGLKADPSARADDQDCRHGMDAPGRTHPLTLIMRCEQSLTAITERTLITISAIGQCPPIAGRGSYCIGKGAGATRFLTAFCTFSKARTSIWRTRSRDTPNLDARSSSLIG